MKYVNLGVKLLYHDIRKYKDNLDEQLDNIVLYDSVVYCKNHTSTKHRDNLCKIYSSVIDSCVTSSQHIPNNSSYKSSKAPQIHDFKNVFFLRYSLIITAIDIYKMPTIQKNFWTGSTL